MFFHNHIRRIAGGTLLGVGVLGTSSLAFVGATHPAVAAGALAAAASLVNCATTTACVTGTNAKSGPGVQGGSNTGIGVRGLSTSGVAVNGSSTANYGVFGTSATGSAGVAGSSAATGVYGSSQGGQGVGGFSQSGVGVIGFSPAGSGTVGSSDSGAGVAAGTNTGTAVQAQSSTGDGVFAFTGGSGADAVLGVNTTGNGADISGGYIGLLGRAPATAFPLVLTDNAGNTLFWVDGHGNVNYRGGINNFARIASGATVTAFGLRTTQPNIEDTGTAQLVAGAAVVRLDPIFASSIDAKTGYRAFLTPHGDTRGLFVATTAPNAFMVRESQGGRATVSFDYRIIATPLGESGRRMAVTSTNLAIPRAALPVMPAAQSPHRLAAPKLP